LGETAETAHRSRGRPAPQLRLQPDFADAHNGLGGALMAQGKIDEAVAHFESAVRLDPTFTAAEHNLATALAVQGNK
jgi:lipoprotein NlpI